MVARITSRDFKRARPSGLRFDPGRWKEFGFGLALGLSLSLIVLIWQNYREERIKTEAAETPKPAARAAPASEAEAPQNDLTFHEKLENFEVVLPVADGEVSRERDNPPANIERPGVYVLQAGAYRKPEDASRVQAQLKKQGIDAEVRQASEAGGTVYRVRIGPIGDLTELNRLRARLRAAEFDDTLVIRVGD